MTDFAVLNYPPILGDGQMAKKSPKFIYEYREQIPHPPAFLPLFFWGDIAHFAHFWGYWPILLFIMGKKGGYVIHVACQNHIFPLSPMVKDQASSPCLNCMGWQDTSLTMVRKIKHLPLILTVLGGRTRAHLDNSSQASSLILIV